MVDNNDDMIDSREVIERIEELESEAASRYSDAHPEGVSWGELAEDHAALLDDEDAEELRILRAFAAEGADHVEDWEHGATLIRDTYFETYARELAEEIGAVSSDAGWPLYCIDWERAARDLKMDYTSVEFDGVTYWGRS